MQRRALSSFALVLGICMTLPGLLTAQTDKYTTSPPGYVSKGQPPTPSATKDRTWGYWLGQFASERFQAADGLFRSSVLVIKEVSYRLDQRTYNSDVVSAGVGRTWSTVTLNMSECDYDKVTNTFSTNSLTKAVEVFNAKVTWATMVGLPANDPAPWGGSGHKFPFKSSWIYTGKKDLLLDYQFRKGALANTAAWSGGTSIRYYLDGYYAATFNLGTGMEYPDSPSKTKPAYCMDSSFGSGSTAAYNNIQGVFVYSADHTSRPKQAFLQWRSFFTAPSAAVIKAVGLGGNASGANAGARCNPLYINLVLPHILIPQTADTNGTSPFTTISQPFDSRLAGLTLWFQCAYEDSKLKAFSLTTASSRTIPSAIPLSSPRRRSITASDADATTGKLNSNTLWGANPMYRITYQ